MNYPLISEYIEAIKAAEDNFEKLTNLRAVLGDDGQPVMTSGNFAVVFKMKDEETGKLYALKCFTKEQEGRAEAYHQIAEELKDVDSPYLVSLRYLEKELFVDTEQTDETEFPVLLMDWVEGKTLDKYLRENLDDKYALEMLAYRFSQLAQWLIPQPFAHGDLKPDNILVRENGSLVLVDYDGMYVPAMKGQKARELGSPDFRHPLRTENDFDEYVDDFPLVSILLSLKAISINSQLLEKYGATDRLLFSKNDYIVIKASGLLNKCACFSDLPYYNSTIKKLINYLSVLLELYDDHLVSLDFSMDIPVPLFNRTTRILPKDILDSQLYVSNNFNARYSKDNTKLLKFIDGVVVHNYNLGETDVEPCYEYQIQPTTITISDHAFMGCHELRFLTIPESVKYIGHGAFQDCHMRYIELPQLDGISKDAFDNCPYLHTIAIPVGTFSLFSKMLPSNIFQLKEVNKEFRFSIIRSYLESNEDKTFYDSMQLLFESVSTIFYLRNCKKRTFVFTRYNNDRAASVWIEDDDCYSSYQLYINNTEDVNEIINSTYCLLLDSGMFDYYTPYQYMDWNKNNEKNDVLF